MNYLSAENLSKSYGDRYLFQNLNFGILKGDKTAIVGINGAGKSTLLHILAGKTDAEAGGVVSIRRGISVGFLSQNPEFNERLSVLDNLFDGDSPLLKAIKAYEKALHSADNEALGLAMTAMEEHQAWDYESRVEQILGKLGIHDLEQNIAQLSGGQRKRVAMAQILIHEPDLMILDEPTNHLDLETIEWLEQLLNTSKSTLLVVTHDRYFLDKVCNQIVELENGKAFTYRGNYGYFLEKKDERQQIEAAEMDKARNLYSRELEWMRRQPQARGTKAQYRIDAFADLDEKVNAQRDQSKFQLNVKMARQGSKILEISYLNKAFDGKPMVKDFTYTFKRGDRLGIVGKNGVGKSTFLNMIMGLLKPDSGKIEVGETTSFGYYTQGDFQFKDDQRVIDIIQDIADQVTVGTGETISASQFLTHFKFEPKQQYNMVAKLSGGEKRRLQLMTVLIKNPNFLILDEPTNDLDIGTLNILEEFLLNFGGCLLLVSHDRYFMDRLVEHLFVFEGEGNIVNFPGNYTDYRLAQSAKNQPNTAKTEAGKLKAANTPTETAKPNTKNKLSYKQQRELEQIAAEIPQLEQKKVALTQKLNAGQADYTQLNALAAEIEALTIEIDTKELRWLTLSEQ
jgi:ABC transport system ATP-binding/permease protein